MVGGFAGHAIPYGGKKKSADSGIDGFIYFKPDGKHARYGAKENAPMAIFITLSDATKPMLTEAKKKASTRHPTASSRAYRS
jgi:hypothetical protein